MYLGLVLSAAAVMPAVPQAAEPRAWAELPVRKWTENELRAQSGGPELLERELTRQGIYQDRWHQVHQLVGGQHMSRKSLDLLARRGLGAAQFKAGATPFNADKALAPDVLRVLLVRVSFAGNRNPGLTTISPDGDFMLDPLADPGPLEIDPPPHNRAFFESHMQGLSEYYRVMSGGRLLIESKVLPEGDNDSYQLSDVADYGPGAGNFWTLDSLERLVRDTITASDAGVTADGLGFSLSDYDDETPFTYVIFVHAGSDWQSDIDGNSPNDIPTFFVTLGEPVALQGTNPGGNPGRLSECSIIPETTSQDGSVGSIAAALYHEFGHALGLPDVYNTSTGLPSVGIWDLMDSGTNLPAAIGTVTAENDTVVVLANGLLPPSLSAWCKLYLGWLEVGEVGRQVSAGADYLLPAVGVPRDQYARYAAGSGDFNLAYPQAYRAGPSPREFVLLENRWVPDGSEPTPFDDIRWETDPETGVVLYLAGQSGGVWENSGFYDYFMPAGGLLAWHVNADRIESELENNTINAYGDGLRLIEADGLQDIGVLDAYVLGWFGSWRDPFGGNDPQGNATGFSDLYTERAPSSRNFDRSVSGVRLSNITRRVTRTSSVMKFKATLDPIRNGFPWQAAPIDSVEAARSGGTAGARAINPGSLTPVTLGGEQVLVFADVPGQAWTGGNFPAHLYGLRPNGAPRWVGVPGATNGAFQALGAPLAGSPLILTHASDGLELVWATRTGRVGSTQLPAGITPSVTWARDVSDSLLAGPVAVRWSAGPTRLLVAAHPDSLYLLDRNGSAVGTGLKLTGGGTITGLQLAVLPAQAGASDQAAVISDRGWHLLQLDAAGAPVLAEFVPFVRTSGHVPPWIAVNPGAGTNVLTVLDEAGVLGSWEIGADGGIAEQEIFPGLDGPLVCAPAVADVDGDGRHDVVLATGTRLYGFMPDGIPLRGFPVRFADLYPLADSTRIEGPLVVADGTGDGVNDVYFNTSGGHLVGLGATGRLLGGYPLRWGDRAGAGLAVGGEGVDRMLWLVSAGGYQTGFKDRIAVSGRVSGANLMPAAAPDKRTSEWLGPGGGPDRNGPSGAVRRLGGASPAGEERDQVYLYPNPLSGDDVTVRFYAGGAQDVRVAIYNLEGELVVSRRTPVTVGVVNEVVMPLGGVASGLYLARIEFEGTGGREIRSLTLAVER